MAEAFVPAEVEENGSVLVVYRGPYREVADDSGRVYRRGEQLRVPAGEWERLSALLPVDDFTRLVESETALLACR